jgi:hypothetical protein
VTKVHARYVLVYSVMRDRWMVEDTTTGKQRVFPSRDKAVVALEKAKASVPGEPA